MSRVALDKIQALTFYEDALTSTRRGQALPQLICVGKACDLFTPDVIRCVNIGGDGTDVDWKCEADLPETLRLGRVQVSCEGWSGPGDPYVLKGSCSLEYRLLQVPKNVMDGSRSSNWFTVENLSVLAFYAIFFYVLYLILKPCFRSFLSRSSSRRPRSPPSDSSSRPSGHGWFPGDHHDSPPPYSKDSSSSASNVAQDGPGGMGFWSGMALGGLGTYLFNNRRRDEARRYDWERERFAAPRPAWGSGSGGLFSRPGPSRMRSSSYQHEDRGEGPSNLGSMRRSTGFGGSNVR